MVPSLLELNIFRTSENQLQKCLKKNNKLLGWIDLPFFISDLELSYDDQFQKIFFCNRILSLPLYLNGYQIQLKQSTENKIPLIFYVFLEASKHIFDTDFKNIACRLLITSDPKQVENTKHLIFIHKYEIQLPIQSNITIEVSYEGGHWLKTPEFSPLFIITGFNYHQIFKVKDNDEDSQIKIYYDQNESILENFSIRTRCLENNSSISTALYSGKKITLKTSNARLVLPDLDDKEFEPIIITIKRYVKFSKKDDFMIIENGLECYPDGDLSFTANLYIKPISSSENIEFSDPTVKMKRIEETKEFLVEINGFSDKVIKELLTKGEDIKVKVALGVKQYTEYNVLDVFLHFFNHEPVSFNFCFAIHDIDKTNILRIYK